MDGRLSKSRQISQGATTEAHFIGKLLNPDTIATVRQVVRNGRRLVDDLLHYSTGLVLEKGGKRLQIAVGVDAVLPGCVAKFVASRTPANMRNSGPGGDDTSLKGWEAEIGAALRRHSGRVQAQLPLEPVQHDGDWLRNSHFDSIFAEFNVDVLGEYDPHNPRICLHGLVIGMVSEVLGLDVRSVSLVALIHEYAHAYTHLGKDIDDNFWSTDDYEKLDTAIKEGLAQFYTAHLCNELEGWQPGLRETFDRLQGVQHAVYRRYQEWSCQGSHIGECIRIAMIKARKNRVASELQFGDCLDEARRVLS